MTLDEIVVPIRTLWKFDYDANVKEQWNAASDVPWHLETDPAQVGVIPGPGGDPLMSEDARTRVEDFAVAALHMLCSPWGSGARNAR